jgi:hypothetical protein
MLVIFARIPHDDRKTIEMLVGVEWHFAGRAKVQDPGDKGVGAYSS